MRRIVLHGDDLAAFPADRESGYVKLVLGSAGATGKAVMRSYTIRRFDPDRRELTLDFVDHGDTGPASTWANHCQPGDAMYVRGPGEWLVNPNNHQPNTLLADAVKALPWLPGTPYPWFAGEFDGMAKQQDPEA